MHTQKEQTLTQLLRQTHTFAHIHAPHTERNGGKEGERARQTDRQSEREREREMTDIFTNTFQHQQRSKTNLRVCVPKFKKTK